MIISLLAGVTSQVDFAPADEYGEIMQNLRTILATPKFSVPLDRDFGVDASYVDLPLPTAQAQIASEIIAAIRKYEPRVTVNSIEWDGDGAEGILKPKVQVIINGTE